LTDTSNNYQILLFSASDAVIATVEQLCSQYEEKDYIVDIIASSEESDAKKLLTPIDADASIPLVIIDFDSIEETNCWHIVEFIRNTLNNEAIRIYISSQKALDMSLMVENNVSELINILDIKPASFLTTLSASLRTFKRIIAINNARKQLKHSEEQSEEDIAGDVKELQQSEKRLQNILDSMLIPVFITGLHDNKLKFINNNSRETFGLQGIDITDFDKQNLYVNPEDHLKAIEMVRKEGKLDNFETKMRAMNGSEYYFIRSSKIISYMKEECELVTFKDISPRKKMEEELKRLATTDALTGLNNRHQLYKLSDAEIKRSKRTNSPLTAMLIDADLFKRINDTYGHKAGDKVLISLANCFMSLAREIDICGRLGGEEFVIVLPETSTNAAFKMAKRLQAAVRNLIIEDEGNTINITVSIGITAMFPGEEDLDTIIHRADMALYKAKETGRDKIIIYDETCDKVIDT
jgi:diguanylate cyclase (GGDEF)-like protein/PAS domain S-box-containing protein